MVTLLIHCPGEDRVLTDIEREDRCRRFVAATDRLPLPATKYAPLLGCAHTHVSDVRCGRKPASMVLVLSAERLAAAFEALADAERADYDAVVNRLRAMVQPDA